MTGPRNASRQQDIDEIAAAARFEFSNLARDDEPQQANVLYTAPLMI